ncbi:MAG: hypothetical protein A3H98_02325 [Bacteroidetes bacterium RIFCSPLOWO2_02_FULL_36_8]|nr:MAG: hypothetical protein A3H98_02325 [Bacteroidetes bacterium RIFCSPLOWO2_02_FULL_36_8]OFY69172.1 MAG: hypothetical protein A3G23_06395 [Bacteroidetes bacterium RIFCSPLOWO2_12_FULL_37_12]
MYFIRSVKYIKEYQLLLSFNTGEKKLVDVKPYLGGEIFAPLKNLKYFKKATLNKDIDTVVWDNGADFSPDFLYKIGKVVKK